MNRPWTNGPWGYRPQKHDDWGQVRQLEPDAEGFQCLTAIARAGQHVTDEEYSAHRRAGTDPYEANARLIAAAPELFEALDKAVNYIAVYAATTGSSEVSAELDKMTAALAKALPEYEGKSP